MSVSQNQAPYFFFQPHWPSDVMTLRRAMFVLCLSIHSQAFAGFEDGVDAFIRGDYAMARREWAPLAASGDPDAARNLGRLYDQGLGVKQDFAEARRYYKIAADKCNATAQNNLGLLLLKGQGGPQDPVGAFRLFQAAANQGLHEDSDAMGNLGAMYMAGVGAQPNAVEAYKWYLLYYQYTTDVNNRQKLLSMLPQIEANLTQSQRSEAIRRAGAFRKTPCIPKN